MTRNTQASKALQTMRNLSAQGWHDERLLIDAAAEALGGDESAKIIAEMTWRKHFAIMGAN
jgi:hypothetical protein